MIDEETELETLLPERPVGRKLLVEFDHFKLNLSYPVISHDVKLNNSSFKASNQSAFINVSSLKRHD